MVFRRYSGPDDVFSRRESEPDAAPLWPAPVPPGALRARVRLPGSKSLTARELVLSALAVAPSVLRAPLHSRDSALMVEALRGLGTGIREVPGQAAEAPDLVIDPAELVGGGSIDTGLAGTVMRFLPPVAALALGRVQFDGDEAARRRPMRPIVDALRALGVDVSDDGRGALPFGLWGSGTVEGGELEIDASASSQFVSALLLAAPRFERGLHLVHRGERLPSTPHIEMTIRCLAERGVAVETPAPGEWIVPPGPIQGREVAIEPDLSNAAPFLVAALVAGGTVAVEGWPAETTQVGAQLEHILPRFGATASHEGGALVIDGGLGIRGGASVPGVDLDLSEAGELTPALVALAALAEGPSRITGIGHLRGHETDRLAALAGNLNRLGGDVTETDDGLEIRATTLRPGVWPSHEDHRMATAGAIVGLAVPGIEVDDVGTTAKTLPAFVALWTEAILGRPGSLVGDGIAATPPGPAGLPGMTPGSPQGTAPTA